MIGGWGILFDDDDGQMIHTATTSSPDLKLPSQLSMPSEPLSLFNEQPKLTCYLITRIRPL